MIIFGIDPGIARLGFGVIEAKGNEARLLTFGCLETKKEMGREKRLLFLSDSLRKLIKKYQPKCLAVERLFFFKNNKTAFAVGEARGVVLLEAARARIPVTEVTPLQVKSALTGYGLASKEQIQKMVKTIFSLKEIPKPDDAADAVAIAFCASGLLTLCRLKN